MRSKILMAIVLLAFGAGAPAAAQRLFGPGLFVSPAGEPFRPASGPAPIEAWFTGADGNRDGMLTREEFRADFARAFALFDTDGDGEIEPAEVSRYELELLPEMRGAGLPGRRRSATAQMRQDRLGRRGSRRVGSTVMMSGAAPFGLLPLSHPIMEADSNFNGGVSRAEFEGAANRRFALLDPEGSGRLSLDDLRARRRHRGRPG